MSQVPDTCVCGGLTGTVTSPTTTVLLPSIPWKVQNPPPTEEILEPSAPQKVMATSKAELSVGAALARAAKASCQCGDEKMML
ncbi:uncharacterized protein An07g01820, partial [Aspergillus niger]|uniref:Uncharacterized protein n=2 Tax=Aspergillus niger TaxID=5061 RepID=A0AAJ8BX76_ASPNG